MKEKTPTTAKGSRGLYRRKLLNFLTRGGVILNPTPMFRLQGKHIFLTYAQAERIENKETLLWALRDKIPSPTAWAIGKENHADGGVHYHVLLGYENRIDIRDMRFYDVEGHHPNAQSVRSTKNVLTYVTKEGDTLIHNFNQVRDEDIYEALIDEILMNTNATDAIKGVLARTGTKGLRLFNQIQGYTDRMMRPSAKHSALEVYPDAFPGVDDQLGAKLLKFNQDVAKGVAYRGDRKSLWLYGPSRLGKTVLARSLGTHWYMLMQWNIDAHDDDAEYGVLDDIDWDSLKRYYKGMMGCQSDITVTDKYKKKTIIQHGRPVIILTNELPIFSVAEASWLEANVVFHYVGHKLYEE
ncbi:Rep [uncultured virus]|uniref:Rep n=1 Tax=uncultured virus TaxID=340016 RepID=A0A2K9LSD8_9VIRU|nr:Rep [uncultured virus]